MYCLFLRLEISPSIQSRFEDTKGWPSLFWSEESNDLFYWAKLAFNQTSRHRHCEVWIERVNTPPWVVTILIVTTVHLVRVIFGIATKFTFKNYFQKLLPKPLLLFQVWRGELESFDFNPIEPGSFSSWESLSTAAPDSSKNRRSSDDASLAVTSEIQLENTFPK